MAEKELKLTLKVDSDTKLIKEFQKQIQLSDKSLSELIKTTKELSKENLNLDKSINKIIDSLKKLQSVNNLGGGLDENKLKNLQDKIKQLQDQIKELKNLNKPEPKTYLTNINESAVELEKSFKSTNIAGDLLSKGLNKAFKEITEAIATATDEALKFEQKIYQMRTVVQDELGGFQEGAKQVIDASQQIGASAISAAEGIKTVYAAGVNDAKDAIKGYQSAQMAALATQADFNDFIKAGVIINNNYGSSVADWDTIFNKIAVAANKSKADVADFAKQVPALVSAFAPANINLDDTLAIFSAFNNSLRNSSEAAVAATNLLTKLQKPTKEMQQIINDINKDTKDIGKKIVFSASGINGDLEKFLQNFKTKVTAFAKDKSMNVADIINSMFKEMRSSKGMQQALNALFTGSFSEIQGAVMNQTDFLKKAYDEAISSILNRWEIFTNNISSDFKKVFVALQPTIHEVLNILENSLNNVIGFFADVIKEFSWLNDSGQLVDSFKLIADGLGKVISQIMTQVGNLIKFLASGLNMILKFADMIAQAIASIYTSLADTNSIWKAAKEGGMSGIKEYFKGQLDLFKEKSDKFFDEVVRFSDRADKLLNAEALNKPSKKYITSRPDKSPKRAERKDFKPIQPLSSFGSRTLSDVKEAEAVNRELERIEDSILSRTLSKYAYETQAIKKEYDKRVKDAKDKLDEGLIDQATYDKAILLYTRDRNAKLASLEKDHQEEIEKIKKDNQKKQDDWEKQLFSSKLANIKEKMNEELANENLSAEEKYKIKVKYLKKEADLYKQYGSGGPGGAGGGSFSFSERATFRAKEKQIQKQIVDETIKEEKRIQAEREKAGIESRKILHKNLEEEKKIIEDAEKEALEISQNINKLRQDNADKAAEKEKQRLEDLKNHTINSFQTIIQAVYNLSDAFSNIGFGDFANALSQAASSASVLFQQALSGDVIGLTVSAVNELSRGIKAINKENETFNNLVKDGKATQADLNNLMIQSSARTFPIFGDAIGELVKKFTDWAGITRNVNEELEKQQKKLELVNKAKEMGATVAEKANALEKEKRQLLIDNMDNEQERAKAQLQFDLELIDKEDTTDEIKYQKKQKRLKEYIKWEADYTEKTNNDKLKQDEKYQNELESNRKKAFDKLLDEKTYALKLQKEQTENLIKQSQLRISQIDYEVNKIKSKYDKLRETLNPDASKQFQSDRNLFLSNQKATTELIRTPVSAFELSQESEKENINNLFLTGAISQEEKIKRLKELAVKANVYYGNVAKNLVKGTREQFEYQKKANDAYSDYRELVSDTYDLKQQQESASYEQEKKNLQDINDTREQQVKDLNNQIDNIVLSTTQMFKDAAGQWKQSVIDGLLTPLQQVLSTAKQISETSFGTLSDSNVYAPGGAPSTSGGTLAGNALGSVTSSGSSGGTQVGSALGTVTGTSGGTQFGQVLGSITNPFTILPDSQKRSNIINALSQNDYTHSLQWFWDEYGELSIDALKAIAYERGLPKYDSEFKYYRYGSPVVNRPTKAVIGEAGPEKVINAQQMEMMYQNLIGGGNMYNNSGQCPGVVININNPTVRKDSDLDVMARKFESIVSKNIRKSYR